MSEREQVKLVMVPIASILFAFFKETTFYNRKIRILKSISVKLLQLLFVNK